MTPSSTRLPARNDLGFAWAVSLAIALLMAGASVTGLLLRADVYPTAELRRWFVLNDAFNLAVGVPFLLASAWLARRGSLAWLLCWPGALFYVLYVFFAYLLAVPFGVLFPAYLVLVPLSASAVIGLTAAIDGEAVRGRLGSAVPARVAGGILLALGVLLVARQAALIAAALAEGTAVATLDLAAWIDDIVVGCPALLVVGVQLWRRKPLGYAAAPGLLLAYGVLALALVPGLLAPLDAAGIAIVLVMALVCLVPFWFFVRGAAERRAPPAPASGRRTH